MLKHKALWAAMHRKGLSYEDGAAVLGLSTQGFIAKLDGRVPWKLWEAYRVEKWLEIPVYDLFPEGEQVAKSIQR